MVSALIKFAILKVGVAFIPVSGRENFLCRVAIMTDRILVANGKYKGKYVALKSFAERIVVASGVDPQAVIARANKKGFDTPVLVFVPENSTTHVY